MWKLHIYFSASKDMKKNNDKKRIPISLLANILTLISKNQKLVLSKVQ
jgi:hypothetical protein